MRVGWGSGFLKAALISDQCTGSQFFLPGSRSVRDNHGSIPVTETFPSCGRTVVQSDRVFYFLLKSLK